jgi:hypothetical protein
MLSKQHHSLYLTLICILVLAPYAFFVGQSPLAAPLLAEAGRLTLFDARAPSPLSPQLSSNAYVLTYVVNRAAVPAVYYRDLTLLIHIGQASAVHVSTEDGSPVQADYDGNSGYLKVTATADRFFVYVTNPVDISQMGNFSKAVLKDNKQWAWSHGLDDNRYLDASIQLLTEKGWRGTLFLIGADIHETRQEPWIIDATEIKQLVAAGWSVGNHTWDHECSPPRIDNPQFMRDSILNGYNRLVTIIQTSPVPDYQVIAFAAPCFRAEYHPYIQEMVANGQTAVRFNESGNDHTLVVDPGASDYSQGGRTAVAFNYSQTIGRDVRLEMGNEGVTAVKAEMDWLSAQAAPGRHFWYNTLSHGHQEMNLNQAVQHAYYLFGPGGRNELWMAPADAIYSYLLVRDHSQVTFTLSNPLNHKAYLPVTYR